MRRLVLYTLMTLDGAVDRPEEYFADGSDGPPVFDDVMVEFEREVIEAQDAVLLGRNMHDEWSRYWPTSNEEPFASFVNGVRKHVVTSRPLDSDWGEVTALEGPIETSVRDLKRTEGGDVGVHGSITLAQGLLAAGLVDELRLVVAPVVGYGGRRLFTDELGVRRFELGESRSSPSGSLLLTYRLPKP
ncbi:dihydrofolate reductase family protein [Angustibacter aerolatus]